MFNRAERQINMWSMDSYGRRSKPAFGGRPGRWQPQAYQGKSKLRVALGAAFGEARAIGCELAVAAARRAAQPTAAKYWPALWRAARLSFSADRLRLTI